MRKQSEPGPPSSNSVQNLAALLFWHKRGDAQDQQRGYDPKDDDAAQVISSAALRDNQSASSMTAECSSPLKKTRNRLPTIPEAKAHIRAIMTSEHTRDQIYQALDILETTARKLRILT